MHLLNPHSNEKFSESSHRMHLNNSLVRLFPFSSAPECFPGPADLVRVVAVAAVGSFKTRSRIRSLLFVETDLLLLFDLVNL